MKTPKMLLEFAVLMFSLAIGSILRLFAWRATGDKSIRSPGSEREFAVVNGAESDSEPYPFIYVLEDGSARELHRREREYLETPFIGADGARPYVKWRYGQKNGWGNVRGFLRRTKLPNRILIGPAPVEDPSIDSD